APLATLAARDAGLALPTPAGRLAAGSGVVEVFAGAVLARFLLGDIGRAERGAGKIPVPPGEATNKVTKPYRTRRSEERAAASRSEDSVTPPSPLETVESWLDHLRVEVGAS